MKVGIVAGEASGDLLGAELMVSLRQRIGDVNFIGVGGERMRTEGLHVLESADRFSMNGFVEPLVRIPELLKVLRSLAVRLADVDVMVGVDFNVFNFMLEKRLKAQGVPTVHYVSPSVYAWRRGRIHTVGKSADVLLTLFPFEPAYYEDTQVKAVFVGHPLANQVDPNTDWASQCEHSRASLAIDRSSTVIALLPGSRNSEIRSHLDLFLRSAERIQDLLSRTEQCVFLVPCAHEKAAERVATHGRKFPHLKLHAIRSGSLEVFAASDVALVKSGTSTLEAMLKRVPMVVAYRAGPITYSIVRAILQTKWVALPNILTQRELVPEFLQQAASSETLAVAVCQELARARSESNYFEPFDQLHRSLRQDASARAAAAVMDLVASRN